MHFQAGNKGFMPFCEEFESGKVEEKAFAGEKIRFCQSAPGHPFVISSPDANEVEQLSNRLVALLPVAEGEQEPMMNVLCWTEQHIYHLAVFVRIKHRPGNYGNGEGQFMLSPASVDMGQAIAVPVEKDFLTLTAENVRTMFEELCISEEAANQLIHKYNLKYKSNE